MEKLELTTVFASMPSDRRFARVGWHRSPACSSDVETHKARSPACSSDVAVHESCSTRSPPHPTPPQCPARRVRVAQEEARRRGLRCLLTVGTATVPQLQHQPLSPPSGRWLLLTCAVVRHLYLPLKLQKGRAVLQREKRLCSNTTPTPPGDSAAGEQT